MQFNVRGGYSHSEYIVKEIFKSTKQEFKNNVFKLRQKCDMRIVFQQIGLWLWFDVRCLDYSLLLMAESYYRNMTVRYKDMIYRGECKKCAATGNVTNLIAIGVF